MSRSRPVRLLGALLALGLTLMVSAASPVPAAATGAGAETRSLPAGARSCPSTAGKPSDPSATCATAAADAAPTASLSLPAGTAACPSTAAKRSSATAACADPGQATGAVQTSGAAAADIPFAVTIAASPVALVPGGTTTLTATSNQNVAATPWFIEIFDLTTKTFLVECGSGTTCSTSVTIAGSAIREYAAYISGVSFSYPPPNIQAISPTDVFVSWLTITVSASPAAVPQGGTSLVTATTGADVGPTPLWIEIFDIRSNAAPIRCGTGSTCAANVTRSTGVSTYVAYVARFGNTNPPPEIRAQSGGFLVTWTSVSLTASPSTLTAGGSTTLTASAGIDVGPTPFWTEIFDQTTGALVAICGSGTTCSGTATQSAATQHSYVAFVANFATSLPPADIRATSSAAVVTWVAPPTPVTVPSLIGDGADQASDELQAAGLVLGDVSSQVDCNSLDRVDHQTPAAGTQVSPGTAVSITVGTRPDPPAECP